MIKKRAIVVYVDEKRVVWCEGGEMRDGELSETQLRKLWVWEGEDDECREFPNRPSPYRGYGGWDFIITLMRDDAGNWGYDVWTFGGVYYSGAMESLDEAVRNLLKCLPVLKEEGLYGCVEVDRERNRGVSP